MTTDTLQTDPAKPGAPDESAAGASDPFSGPAPEVPREIPLPALRTELGPKEVLDKLAYASRRGRMPGFERRSEENAFQVAAFGQPFDRIVVGRVGPADDAGRCEIAFKSVLLKKMPIAFIVTFVVSIWPGLPILDSFIPGSWGWWPTWTWYIPMCLLPLPFVPRMWRKSEQLAHNEAHKMVRRIAAELKAEPVGPVTS
ncbi:MAG: hypothetical protein EA376_02195 [Phycisphaeraceae bacterium]|nr:MAG: hypothetical protein EA376_02195 [Phycisphaeraceae bacterium]